MYTTVIFDFDYTLGDSHLGIVASVNYALEKLGFATGSVDEIKKTIGLSLPETFRTLTSVNDTEKETLFSTFFKEKADIVMVDNTQLYPHTLDVITKLREKGCRIAIVTTKFHYRIDAILTKFNACQLIDCIVGGEDVSAAKPDPEGLLYAIDKLHTPKENVLYVGDSIVDAKTAVGADVDFAGVLTGTTGIEKFLEYPHIFIGKSLTDIYNNVFAPTL